MVPRADQGDVMADREELKGRDDKYRKDEPDTGRPEDRPSEPERRGSGPGRQGQGAGDSPGGQPGSGRKGTGSEVDDTEDEK
jgi:hypothetical protein